ncbi:MAG: hypothetical protein LBQ86_04175 [Holophagales bacterium]|nr:hypothetical protein [Holophagales bacterium]
MTSYLKASLFCAAVITALPLAAQVPPFADGPAFGGTKLFSEELNPWRRSSQTPQAKEFIAFGYSQGEQGADNFMSCLGDFESGNPSKISAAILKLAESPWGLRSRAYGMAISGNGTTLTLSREEMTSLWADAQDSEIAGFGVDFDTRRSVVDRFAVTYSSQGKYYYGSTLRVERWRLGRVYNQLGASLSQAKSLLDYDETQNRNTTYALDAFIGAEIGSGMRLAVKMDRLASRRLWDVEEKPQYRAGLQMDLGAMFQITLESDINEAMRMPFPVDQKTAVASLKVKANSYITFAIGAERKTMDGRNTTRTGINVWITGKKYHLGAGVQLGQDETPWGATWMIQ